LCYLYACHICCVTLCCFATSFRRRIKNMSTITSYLRSHYFIYGVTCTPVIYVVLHYGCFATSFRRRIKNMSKITCYLCSLFYFIRFSNRNLKSVLADDLRLFLLPLFDEESKTWAKSRAIYVRYFISFAFSNRNLKSVLADDLRLCGSKSEVTSSLTQSNVFASTSLLWIIEQRLAQPCTVVTSKKKNHHILVTVTYLVQFYITNS
jgi:hypothetical protein